MRTIFSFLLTYSCLALGISADLTFETSDFMKRTAYERPERIALEFSDTGAYSPVNQAYDKTRTGSWYIEEQRYAADAVGGGIAYGRKDVVDRAIKIFDWGFQQQRPDGSFDCPDAFHSAAFFVEAAARSALLLQQSSMAAQYKPWIDSIKPKLLAEARWMVANEKKGIKHDSPYTHRAFLDAAALGFAGLLNADQSLIEHSKQYIRDGLARQDPSGFNPEKGGFDSSYHAVGLLFAIRYYSWIEDVALREAMGQNIDRGIAWLKTKIAKDGFIDPTGNTRTGLGQEEGRNHNVKFISYGSVYRTLYYWGQVRNDSSLKDLAEKVYEADKKQRRLRKQK